MDFQKRWTPLFSRLFIFFGFIGLVFIRFQVRLRSLQMSVITISQDWVNYYFDLAWGIWSLSKAMAGYWSPPFYAPLPNALGFSDHGIALAILAAPIQFMSNNLVFTYNILILASFVLSGFAVYLIGSELTDSHASGFLAGALFTFSQARLGQLDHLHVLSFYGLPFFLFFALRFIKSSNTLWFGLSFLAASWQILAGLGTGLLTFYISASFWIFMTTQNPLFRSKPMMLRLFAFQALLGLVLIWAAWPNLLAKAQHGETVAWKWNDIQLGSLTWGRLLCAWRGSFFAQNWMEPFWRNVNEHAYFPGFVVLVLLTSGLFQVNRSRAGGRTAFPVSEPAPSGFLLKIRRAQKHGSGSYALGCALFWFAFLAIGFSFAVYFFPPDMSMGIHWEESRKIVMNAIAALLTLAWILFDPRMRAWIGRVWSQTSQMTRLFIVLAVATFFFSFSVPYRLLTVLLPGFDGMRVPGRLMIVCQLSLCLLAAVAAKNLGMSRIRSPLIQSTLIMFLAAIGVAESGPFRMPLSKSIEISDSTKWLAAGDPKKKIVELPFSKSLDDYPRQAPYVFNLAHHWRPIVNGYASHVPAYYHWIALCLKESPLIPADYLDVLQVDTVLCHWDLMEQEDRRAIRAEIEGHSSAFSLERDFGNVSAYRLKKERREHRQFTTMALPKGAAIRVPERQKKARFMVDGKAATHWGLRRAQKSGDFLEIDWAGPVQIEGVLLQLGSRFLDFPRAIRVEIRENGQWIEVARERRNHPTALDFSSIVSTPRNPSIHILFKPRLCDAIRISLTEDEPTYHWSIAELRLVIPKATNGRRAYIGIN